MAKKIEPFIPPPMPTQLMLLEQLEADQDKFVAHGGRGNCSAWARTRGEPAFYLKNVQRAFNPERLDKY
jgi:hypothetical protein